MCVHVAILTRDRRSPTLPLLESRLDPSQHSTHYCYQPTHDRYFYIPGRFLRFVITAQIEHTLEASIMCRRNNRTTLLFLSPITHLLSAGLHLLCWWHIQRNLPRACLYCSLTLFRVRSASEVRIMVYSLAPAYPPPALLPCRSFRENDYMEAKPP